jgi:hypothetical protein
MKPIEGYIQNISRPVTPVYVPGAFKADHFQVSEYSDLTIKASVKTELLDKLVSHSNDPVYIISKSEYDKLISMKLYEIMATE